MGEDRIKPAVVMRVIKDKVIRLRQIAKVLFTGLRKNSAGKVLWLWALLMLSGLFLFKLASGNLPGMNTTLVFAQWWENDLESGTLEKLCAEFEAANPGVTVKLEQMNWNAIVSLVKGEGGAADSREVLDVFSIDLYGLHEQEGASFLAPLTAEDEGEEKILQVCSFISTLYYNIDLLEAAGFDRPPKNQTELLSYVQRIGQAGGGIYGAGLALGNGDPRNASAQLLSWIWAALGSPETISGDEKFSFTGKEMMGVLSFLRQLKEGLYPNPFTLTEAELLKAFGEGKVGMMIGSVADIRDLNGRMNFGITTIPGPESYAKKPVFPLSAWYAGINKQSPHREEAQKLIAFLKEKAPVIAVAAHAVPGSGRRNRELSQNDPYYAKAFDMYEAGEMVRERYGTPEPSALVDLIRREVELLLKGTKTPEQCAASIQQGRERIAGR